MANDIREVIIPAAGKGTRFLPITQFIPKEMLPILNKPAAYYIMQEAYNAGLTSMHFVLHPTKKVLEHYLFSHAQLASGKNANAYTISYAYQQEQRGLGHAIAQVQEAICGERFAVMLPDDFVVGAQESAMEQLCAAAISEDADAVLALAPVSAEKVSSFGIARVEEYTARSVAGHHDSLVLVTDLIEKPSPQRAPSNLAIVGRYIVPRMLFSILAETAPSPRGEIELTDALKTLIAGGKKVLGCVLKGHWLGTGTPADWLKTNNYFASQNAQ